MAETPPLLEPDTGSARGPLVPRIAEPPPPHSDAANAEQFTAHRQNLDAVRSAPASVLAHRGKNRPNCTRKRGIQCAASGPMRVPDAMREPLNPMRRAMRKTDKAARTQDERDAPWSDPPGTPAVPFPTDAPHSSELRTTPLPAGEPYPRPGGP